MVPQRLVAEVFLELLAEVQLEGERLLPVVRARRVEDDGSQRRLRSLPRPLRFICLRRLRRRLPAPGMVKDGATSTAQLAVTDSLLPASSVRGYPHLDLLACVLGGHGVGGARRSPDVRVGSPSPGRG